MITPELQTRLFQHYPMLQELPAAEQDRVLTNARWIRLEAGCMVFDEQQQCQGFPMLLSGSIRVIKAAPSGRELQLYRILPGESCILTSSCLLGRTPYQARGITEQSVEMIALAPEVFHHLLNQHDAFRRYVFNLFSERLTDLMQLVTAVAFHKLDQRLAARLVEQSSPLHTTHQALADEMGSAREIVSRLLKGFADQGWVRLSREQIDILDAPALKKLSAS